MTKEYEFSNFNQLAEVISSENFERLSQDLISWLKLVVQVKEMQKEKDLIINNYRFLWLDDKKHENFIELINTKTGEITRLGGKEW